MNIEIRNGYLIIPQKDKIFVEKKDIFIQDNIIKYTKLFIKSDKIIDAENCVIFPGLVNAHHHIYSYLSKGIPAKTPFKDFIGTLSNLWWKLDRALLEDDVRLSTILTLQDCLRNGVTTIFDHHISANYIEGSLDTMAEVFENFGLNGVLCFEISNRNGNEVFQKSLKENIRFIKNNESTLLKGMVGIHASFTLDNENLKVISQKTEDFPIHIHIAEGKIDEMDCQKKYKKSIIERLESFGLLRPDSLLIHCSNLSVLRSPDNPRFNREGTKDEIDEEINILQNRNIYLVQAVDSNMNNALNIANISKLINAGLPVTVGTDGMGSNILKSYKNSFLFTKYQNQNPDIGFTEMEAMFLNSYKLKKAYGFPVGILENEPADIAVFDYKPATPFNEDTFLAHFIYGITESQARWVIKGDAILLDNFRLKSIDKYDEIISHSIEISKKMFDRFKELD